MLPKAPGTFGSLASIPLIYLIAYLKVSLVTFLVTTALVTVFTCVLTDQIQKKIKLHDPQWIVIDEVLGMLCAWAFIYPQVDIINLSTLFITFRFFDIIKFWPASYFDKMTHGAGTILDDIVSGIFTGVVLVLGNYFLKPI